MPQANQIIDSFGTWDVIGNLAPIYNEWIEYPNYTESLSGTTKLTFEGNISDARSYGYIRVRYQINAASAYGEWHRIYPSEDEQIFVYPHPPEFGQLKISPRRYWQIQKRHWERSYIGTAPDTIWKLKIEVCNEEATGQPTTAETEAAILGLI